VTRGFVAAVFLKKGFLIDGSSKAQAAKNLSSPERPQITPTKKMRKEQETERKTARSGHIALRQSQPKRALEQLLYPEHERHDRQRPITPTEFVRRLQAIGPGREQNGCCG